MTTSIRATLGSSLLALGAIVPGGVRDVAALPLGVVHEVVCDVEISGGPERGSWMSPLSCPDQTMVFAVEEARAFLVETATPGYTMSRQGAALAIARLHPEFVLRLARSIREARSSGLPEAGIFSAYRPPAFGVGGFSDKFSSLHTYGLAVDLTGIGAAGTSSARYWHEIAERHGVICPYGPEHRAEWNHCQPTGLKSVSTGDGLRRFVNPEGPRDLMAMFAAGDAVIAQTIVAHAVDRRELKVGRASRRRMVSRTTKRHHMTVAKHRAHGRAEHYADALGTTRRRSRS